MLPALCRPNKLRTKSENIHKQSKAPTLKQVVLKQKFKSNADSIDDIVGIRLEYAQMVCVIRDDITRAQVLHSRDQRPQGAKRRLTLAPQCCGDIVTFDHLSCLRPTLILLRIKFRSDASSGDVEKKKLLWMHIPPEHQTLQSLQLPSCLVPRGIRRSARLSGLQ